MENLVPPTESRGLFALHIFLVSHLVNKISLLCTKQITKTDVCETEPFPASISFDFVSFAGLRTAPSTASTMLNMQSASADRKRSNRTRYSMGNNFSLLLERGRPLQ